MRRYMVSKNKLIDDLMDKQKIGQSVIRENFIGVA
jgi:hypothetical protein